MVGKILFVVDGSVPARETAAVAHDLFPNASEVLVLQVVPQLPRAWIAWPAFPSTGEDLVRAAVYVSEVAKELEAQGRKVSTRVHFSVLSAGEMDREILWLAETLRPDLICLTLDQGSVTARVVREACMPVLVAKPSSPGDDAAGRRVERREYLEPALVHRALLLNPAVALIFRRAGIL